MEQTPPERTDISKYQELFEYEMTEVILNLKGEYAAFSGKGTRFEEMAVEGSRLAISLPKPEAVTLEEPGVSVPEVAALGSVNIPAVKQTAAAVEVPEAPPPQLRTRPAAAAPEKPELKLPEIASVGVALPKRAAPELSAHPADGMLPAFRPPVMAAAPEGQERISVPVPDLPGTISGAPAQTAPVEKPALDLPGVPKAGGLTARPAVQATGAISLDLPKTDLNQAAARTDTPNPNKISVELPDLTQQPGPPIEKISIKPARTATPYVPFINGIKMKRRKPHPMGIHLESGVPETTVSENLTGKLRTGAVELTSVQVPETGLKSADLKQVSVAPVSVELPDVPAGAGTGSIPAVSRTPISLELPETGVPAVTGAVSLPGAQLSHADIPVPASAVPANRIFAVQAESLTVSIPAIPNAAETQGPAKAVLATGSVQVPNLPVPPAAAIRKEERPALSVALPDTTLPKIGLSQAEHAGEKPTISVEIPNTTLPDISPGRAENESRKLSISVEIPDTTLPNVSLNRAEPESEKLTISVEIPDTTLPDVFFSRAENESGNRSISVEIPDTTLPDVFLSQAEKEARDVSVSVSVPDTSGVPVPVRMSAAQTKQVSLPDANVTSPPSVSLPEVQTRMEAILGMEVPPPPDPAAAKESILALLRSGL